MIRVLILAPHLALRAGLQQIISIDENIEVVGEAASLSNLESLACLFDVLLYAAPDARFAIQLEGYDLFRAEAGQGSPALLLLSDTVEEGPRLDQLPVRGWGVLPFDAPAEEITAAIRAVDEGLVAGAAELVKAVYRLSQARPDPTAASNPALQTLTAREEEVLQLLAHGLPNKQIARVLNISEHTVKFHISSVYAKLGSTNRTEAVRTGVQRGLVVL